MENYSIMLPSYSIGGSIYEKINSVCSFYGQSAVIIGGELSLKAAEEKIRKNATEIRITGTLNFGTEASTNNINLLCENSLVKSADMIFAVGGGKALDTCKAAGELLCKNVFTFPTIASTCAATTAVSILYNDDGTFLRPFFLKAPPKHAFIDTDIIAAAPYKYMWAGIGDTLAKYYEAGMSSSGEELVHYFQLGSEVSRMCAEPVFKYGEIAVRDNKLKKPSYELEQIVLAIIVTTGIASILLTAEHTIDYNSGLAHAVFYTLTSFPQIEKNHLHGEVVAFGILLLLLVWGKRDEFEKLYAFMKSIALPVSPDEIEISESEAFSVISRAAAMPDVAHSAVHVTKENLTVAFKTLLEYNQVQ